MPSQACTQWVLGAALLALSSGVAAADVGALVKVKVGSGPAAGTHTLTDSRTCTLGNEGGRVAFNGVFVRDDTVASNRKTSLHDVFVSVPSVIDPKHAGALSFELVFAPTQKGPRSSWKIQARHLVDTRPDSMLERYELADRGAGKLSGRGGVKLQKHPPGSHPIVTLEIWGVTADNVRVDATIECHSVDGNWLGS
jgi:hypothetical protein